MSETIYETCSAKYADSTAELIKCVSDEQDTQRLGVMNGLDTFFLIFAGAMVFFMQTGFAMLAAGSCRAKNVKNVILWNLLDSCGGGLAYWATGYAFSYGSDDTSKNFTFLGSKQFFLANFEDVRLEFFFFQFAFACALSSIVAGTIAERTQMKAYLMYSTFIVAIVYPVIAHAFWSQNGFLSNIANEPLLDSGIVDLAGSGPVHMAGGVAALACVLVLGNRVGRFHDKDGNPYDEVQEMPPHSVTLQFLGTFCLWFGWYGFNPGSTLFISNENVGNVASLVTVNTTLAACAGAISGLFTSTILDYFVYGYHTYDIAATMNGCLTGLVAITAPCASVEPWAAVVIGIVAGWVYIGASKLLIRCKIDDVCDAIPVHMFGGMWGVLSTGLFSTPDLMMAAYGQNEYVGWFYEWARGTSNAHLLGCQLIGIAFIFGWVFTIMYAFFYVINALGWLRIDYLEEEVGLDISRHKGSCYDMSGAKEEDVVALQNSRHKTVDTNGSKRKDEQDSDDASPAEA